MDVALGLAQGMGPERVCPNQHEDAGPQEAPEGVPDPVGDWSGEEPEEEEEEEDSGGYLYQPLNQDPEQGPWEQSLPAAEEATGSTEPAPGIQERLQMMRLHLPDPPVDSEDEEEAAAGAGARGNQGSIPMDPEHVELVKRTMASVKLPSLGIPAWASEISDEQWKDMVQRTLQARQNRSISVPEWK
ncbi:male-enhanced antigen 1 [Alligator mississippiensis]|uniref:male-enhanced antigen 1 n=1 Tax=Alligator mississippiensis TaxID=8496 RepID=UPI0003D0869A|nr:male-enhanced antigen 1 [Alligator mississippiensis]